MIRALGVLALAALLPAGLAAQRINPPPEVLGRTVTLSPQGGGAEVRGELLAVRGDSAWLLQSAPARVVAVAMPAIREARVQRHRLTASRGMEWGLAVGAISGIALTAACSSVEGNSGCGGVLVGMVLGGALYGGIAAISLSHSSRWRIEPVTPEALAPYARFPQGPPDGVSLPQLARPDSLAAPGTTRP